MKKKLLFRFILLFVIFTLSALIVWPKGPDLNLERIGIPINKELKLNNNTNIIFIIIYFLYPY